jgi:mycobactin peptide synthetase MbtE
VTEATGTRVDEQRLKLLHRKLAERGLSRSAAPAGETAAGSPALSDGQRRMWFVQSMDPHSALLNVCVSYRLTGGVDTARLHQAADAVAVRHPVLRTTYYTDHDGELHAVTHADLRPGWAEHDLSALAPQARRLRLEVLAQREFARPFDLAADPPLRITVVRVGQDEVVLLLTAHHIAWDDGSWSVFFSELTGAYTEPHKPGVARPSAGAAATDAAAIG